MESSDLSPQELLTLLGIAGELATETDHQKLVHTILLRACDMTGSPDGAVLLHDAERGGLFFAAAAGSEAAGLLEKWGETSNQRVPLETSKAGRAFLSGQATPELDVPGEHFKGVDEQTGKQSTAILSIPLDVAGTRIGVLQVLNKPVEYDARDREILAHLSRLAATAIHRVRMMRKLTAQMGLYSRESNEDLVERLDGPATQEQLTVMFADLRGFTQLCQSQADAETTRTIINDLLTLFAEAVLGRGGIVNKFVGDAIFGIFRREGAAIRSVRCAFDMLERFDSLRRRWDETCNVDLSFLDLGIGIATGPAALGTFGNSVVRDFTAIGTVVNLAAAFEAAARNGKRVLIDNSTFSAVQSIVDAYDGPKPFELGKPGQGVFVKYRHFHVKSLLPDRPVRIFVSHSHRDREVVERTITAPLAKQRIETWYSNTDIIPGQKFVQEIETGLLKCDWVFVLVTPHSVASDWVRAEVSTAMRDPRFDQRIVPLTLGDAEARQLSPDLAQLHSLNIRDVADVGDLLTQFVMKRETELRAAARR
jgi:adenylate cyclase